MTKIIGGLLVVSLISHPAIFKIQYLAYEVLKSRQQIIYVYKQAEDPQKTNVTKFDDMMGEIESQTRSIVSLMKEKETIANQLQTILDARAYAKKALNKSQMEHIASFAQTHAKESVSLQETLALVHKMKNLNEVKNEILHNDTDYEVVFSSLNQLSAYQSKAIHSLSAIVEEGRRVLTAL